MEFFVVEFRGWMFPRAIRVKKVLKPLKWIKHYHDNGGVERASRPIAKCDGYTAIAYSKKTKKFLCVKGKHILKGKATVESK